MLEDGTTGWFSPATGFTGCIPKSSGERAGRQGRGDGEEGGGEDNMGPGLQGVHRGTEVKHGQTPTEGDQLNQPMIDTIFLLPLFLSHDLETARAARQKP